MQPIIVIGMHRSGSSLLVSLLQELGVFMGNDLEHNLESEFFIQINEWMMQQAGASWDNPNSFLYISDEFKTLMTGIIDVRLKSYHRREYLGRKNYSKYKSVKNLDFLWGWKDPRNTFTSEVWKEIFPEAKIIHIYRNPVDVISSLFTRERTMVTDYSGNPSFVRLKKSLFGRRLPSHRLIYHSFKSVDSMGAFGLWKEYMAKALEITSDDKVDSLQVSYENLIEEPAAMINQIIEFCNIKPGKLNPEKFLKSIDNTRKYAFKNNPEMVEFYGQIKEDELVARLGYGNIT